MMNDKPEQNQPKQGRQATYNGQPMRGFILPEEHPQQDSMPPAKMMNDKPEQRPHKHIFLQSRFNLLLQRRIPVPLWVIIVSVLFGLALFINMITFASINAQPTAALTTTPSPILAKSTPILAKSTPIPAKSTPIPVKSTPVSVLHPTPTLIPTPTQPPKWTNIYTFTGNGDKKSTIFTVPDTWRLVWSCNPASDFSGEYNVIIDVKGSDGSDVDPGAVNTICKAGNIGDSTQEYQGGSVYLDVVSGAFTIQVQVLK